MIETKRSKIMKIEIAEYGMKIKQGDRTGTIVHESAAKTIELKGIKCNSERLYIQWDNTTIGQYRNTYVKVKSIQQNN